MSSSATAGKAPEERFTMATEQPTDRPTQPLRDEHHDLLPPVDRLAHAADEVGETPLPALPKQLDAIDAFLTGKLLPRAQAEDAVLYPRLAGMLGTLEATSMMNRDHAHLQRLT